MDTANNFAVAMNFDDPLEDPEDLYLYIAEFANMICGRATTYINNEYKEREFWLAPPSVLSAQELEITSESMVENSIYYITKHGIFLINVGFE